MYFLAFLICKEPIISVVMIFYSTLVLSFCVQHWAEGEHLVISTIITLHIVVLTVRRSVLGRHAADVRAVLAWAYSGARHFWFAADTISFIARIGGIKHTIVLFIVAHATAGHEAWVAVEDARELWVLIHRHKLIIIILCICFLYAWKHHAHHCCYSHPKSTYH